jgi:hypothetical protein
MAGQKVACRQCGAKIRIPAAAEPTKPAIAAARGAADEPTPLSSYTCAVCQKQFAVTDVYDQEGTVICKGCFAVQQTAGTPEPEDPIQCASCGASIAPGHVEEWDGRLMCASCATLAAARPVAPASLAARKPIPKKSNASLFWIIGGSVAAVVLVVVVVAMRSNKGRQNVAQGTEPAPVVPKPTVRPVQTIPDSMPASDDVLPRLVQLRSQALDQEGSGDLKGAAATYQQMLDLGEHATNASDAATSQVATAKSALATVNEKLAAAMPVSPPPPVAPATNPSPAIAMTPEVPPVNQSWEQQHGARIRELLHQADARLAANDVFKATLLYQQLFAVVGTHLPEIKDPDLKRLVTAAAATRGKLLVQVKSSPESVSLTADTLLASGLEALQESHWQAGLESLSDVRALFERNVKMPGRAVDPKYLMALHGMAVAYLKLKEAPKAGELFDDTAPLGSAVARSPNREMVINRAALDIIQRTKAMRAAKSLTAWLEKHPGDKPDEDLLNILGTALFIAEQHTTGKSKLDQFAQVYQKENERLEKTRPGEKRWGVEWLPAREADKKIEERSKALTEYAQLSHQAALAYDEWQKLTGWYNTFSVNGARKASLGQVQAAERSFNGYSSQADEARKKIPDMTWLTTIEPVLPPLPAGMTAVAVAAPSDTGGDQGPSVFSIPNITLHDAPTPAAPASPDSTTETAPPVKPVHISVPRYALAFPIDKTKLISSADVIGQVDKVRMVDSQGQPFTARVVARDEHLALLELDAGQGGFSGYVNVAQSFAGGPVQCACVPQESVFGPQPVSLSGQAVAPPQQGSWAVSLADHPRLPGSPLLDAQGQLIGVVIAKRDDLHTRLPTISLSQIRQFLSAQSALPATPSARPDPMNVLEVTVQEN